jgi:large subunit ribosomal protein L4e
MAARPLVTLSDGSGEQVALPAVFTAPVRPDIVHTVHTNMAKNHRQPYAVFHKAGTCLVGYLSLPLARADALHRFCPQATRRLPSLGALAAPCRVFRVCRAAERTAPARARSATCAAAATCTRRPRCAVQASHGQP